MSDTKNALLRLLRRKSVRFGVFTLASGAQSDFYVDCRVTTMDAVGAGWIGELGWQLIRQACLEKGLSIDSVGGLTMGADPVALAIAMASARESEGAPSKAIQAFSVRKSPKAHGLGRQIEGNFESGQTVAVVDDVITTGGSTIQAIDAIEAAGGCVALAVVVVDREEGGRQAIEERGVPVYAITTKTELRSAASEP